jgi:ADP-heptose:LPS heptosyltransferase
MRDKASEILVVRQDRLGDAINAIPALTAIRHSQPEARVSFMVAPALTGLFAGQPYLDRVVPWEDGLGRLTTTLRRGRYDVLLMLHPSKLLAWSALGAGIRQKTGLGFRPYYLLTGFQPALLDQPEQMHEALMNLRVAAAAGLCHEQLTPPRIYLEDGDRRAAEAFLSQNKAQEPILVFPANRGSAPNWPPGKYRQLIERLVGLGLQVVAVSAPGEEEALAESVQGTRAIVWPPNPNLRELAGLISLSRAVIASSTGGLHLAAAVGVRTIGLFCPHPPFHPRRWGPTGDEHRSLAPADDSCGECQADRQCFLPGISLEDVLNAIER